MQNETRTSKAKPNNWGGGAQLLLPLMLSRYLLVNISIASRLLSQLSAPDPAGTALILGCSGKVTGVLERE